MDVNELLTGLDRKLAETEDWIDQLRTELAEAEKTVNDLRREPAAVRSAVRRFAGSAAAGEAVEAADPTWLHLSQVDAVERAVRDAGPLHLQDIVDLLAAKGRRSQGKAFQCSEQMHIQEPTPNHRVPGAAEVSYKHPFRMGGCADGVSCGRKGEGTQECRWSV